MTGEFIEVSISTNFFVSFALGVDLSAVKSMGILEGEFFAKSILTLCEATTGLQLFSFRLGDAFIFSKLTNFRLVPISFGRASN
jgi:hypothetical protein